MSNAPVDATERAFTQELRARRQAVLSRLPADAAAARFVFALLMGSARAGHAELKPEAVEALAARQDQDLDALVADDGVVPHSLRALLLQRPFQADQIDLLNALFAVGFAAELESLSPDERRARSVQVVKLLPGVERLGPFVLSDFVDHACGEEDALRFWQIYVDRVAAEIARRTAETPPSREAWLLTDLLRLHEQGPAAGDAGAWTILKNHMNRVLQAPRHRSRFARTLAEGCADPRLLYALCTSPALVDDPEVVAVFLERGDPRLTSCGLFVLQVRGGLDGVVDRVIAHFDERPLPEVGERLVDLHAQLHLSRAPSPSLQRLAEGLRRVAQRRVAEGAPVEALLSAVANDPRALRQVALLADCADVGRRPAPPSQRPLLDRVINVWLQSFTPGGLRHPLNDDIFRRVVARAGVGLLAAADGDLIARLERFGLDLPSTARRWVPGDEAARRRLLSRFLSAFGHTLDGMARAARELAPGLEQAVYTLMVQIYVALPAARGTGWFGVVDHVLPVLFPDLLRATPTSDRVAEAGALVAELERQAAARERPPAAGEATAAAVEAAEAAADEAPLSAPVEVLQRAPGPLGAVLRAWLGIELVAWASAGVGRLAGLRRRAQATLAAGTLHVEGEARLLGRSVGRLEIRQGLDSVTGVHVRQRARLFPVVLGLAVLVAAAVIGGQVVFAGLRDGGPAAALPGLALIALGLLFDGAMTHLSALGRRTVVLELFSEGRATPLALQVDTTAGAPLLDAVLGADARRRELARYARWATQEAGWEGDDAADDEAAAEDVATPDEAAADAGEAPTPPEEEGAEAEEDVAEAEAELPFGADPAAASGLPPADVSDAPPRG